MIAISRWSWTRRAGSWSGGLGGLGEGRVGQRELVAEDRGVGDPLEGQAAVAGGGDLPGVVELARLDRRTARSGCPPDPSRHRVEREQRGVVGEGRRRRPGPSGTAQLGRRPGRRSPGQRRAVARPGGQARRPTRSRCPSSGRRIPAGAGRVRPAGSRRSRSPRRCRRQAGARLGAERTRDEGRGRGPGSRPPASVGAEAWMRHGCQS